jgi:hypothetical protein
MHGDDNIKFINAQQARLVYRYRNTKEKLLKINASMWFNKVCILQMITHELMDV